MRAAVLGASGYAGAELLRLCASHPELEVVRAAGDRQAGEPIASLYPSLAAAYGDSCFDEVSDGSAEGVDLVFLALPHGRAQELVPTMAGSGARLVDLSADYRLKDPSLYPSWYGAPHPTAELLDDFVYGLPELDRSAVRGARLVAVPGCYPTAAALALSPLVRAGAVERQGVVVDAASGVSGAGRGLSHNLHFGTANEDFVAYSLLAHRHTPEIEQATGCRVVFTPHLAPMTRGILVTCYARATAATSTAELLGVLDAAYGDEPFLVVSERSPSTKATWGSNSAHLTARFDERTGWILALCALDNLMKGAAGQAVQCANLALGLPETIGLPATGVYP
jgi:N-acetyl-gamma-glutamyl-phosphate reductase